MDNIEHFNSDLDLSFERIVPVSRQKIWRAWTEPELLMKWFCPQPWRTIQCEINLRPGGKFETTMQSPEGLKVPNTACYLEIIPFKKNHLDQFIKPRISTKVTPNELSIDVSQFSIHGMH